MEEIAGSQKDGNEDKNLLVLRDELNWTAHEAEVANLRSELLLRRLIHVEEDIVKIKESISMALEVSMEMNEKIGRLEGQLNSEKRRKQIVSSVNIAKEVSISHDLSTTQLSYLERQVLDVLSTNGPMGTLEIKGKIGRSREHMSRLLGKLVDRGLVGRSRTGRQVIYNIYDQSSIQKDDEEKLGSSTPPITPTINANGENELKDDNESLHTHP